MTIAAGQPYVAADLLSEHNADGTHKSATGSHITHAQLASGTGTNTHAQIDTHLGASAAVHGLPASVNVLGAQQAAGLRVEYGSASASCPNAAATDITITWANAFTTIACAVASLRSTATPIALLYSTVKSYSTTTIVLTVNNNTGGALTFYVDAIGIGT